jgi:hypothetical protein
MTEVKEAVLLKRNQLIREQDELPDVPKLSKKLTLEQKNYLRRIVRWWILQGQIDLLNDLIHGGAGKWEEGIIK